MNVYVNKENTGGYPAVCYTAQTDSMVGAASRITGFSDYSPSEAVRDLLGTLKSVGIEAKVGEVIHEFEEGV